MTKPVDHEAEAKRYDRLAKEARNQVTSAKPAEYYEQKAKEHRAKAKEEPMSTVKEGRYPSKQSPKMKALADQAEKDAVEERRKKPAKKKTNEAAPISGLAFLVESELEKATVVNAAEGILEKLQKMASELASIEADDIMPILDSMRMVFGPEITDRFDNVTNEKIRSTVEAVKGAKEAITSEVSRLKADVNGEPVNDMGMDDTGTEGGDDLDLDAGEDAAAMDGTDDLGAEPELSLTGDEDGGAEGDGGPAEDDLDAAFDGASDEGSAAGRAKKESVERNIKALSESADPDRLVFEVFRRTLKESKGNAVRSAKAVAEAFAIDFQDVVAIIREGKTFKDEKGKTNKNKDFSQARKDKKRDRPSDLDEGKTFKDEKGRNDKNKDRSEDRKTKKRERPSDLDEAVFGAAKAPKKPNPFGKKPPEDGVPSDFGDMKKKQVGGKKIDEAALTEFEMTHHKDREGMFKGKTKEELHKMLSDVKAKMKSHEDKGDKVPDALRTKFSELEFALRAKNDWGKAEESVKEAAKKSNRPFDLAEAEKGGIIVVSWHKKAGEGVDAGQFETRDRAEADKKAATKRADGFTVELHNRKGPSSLTKIKEGKGIVSLKKDDGSYHEVGMNHRTLIHGSEGNIRKHASTWARGKPHRIEYFGDNIHTDPHKVEHHKGVEECVTEAAMSLEDAKKIVGRTNSTEPYLSNMIKALSMMSAMNTPEENERLQAAKMVKASIRKSTRKGFKEGEVTEGAHDAAGDTLEERTMKKADYVTYAATSHAYRVQVWRDDQQVDDYVAGNHRGDRAAFVEPDCDAACSTETMQKFAKQTAMEMAAEWHVDPDHVSYDKDDEASLNGMFEVKEGQIDLLASREKALDRARDARKAKGFTVMKNKEKAPVKENESKLIASFDGPGSFDDARGLRDALRAKGQNVFMERSGASYHVIQPVEIDEDASGAKVLVMKQPKKPKGKPFKAAARKLPEGFEDKQVYEVTLRNAASEKTKTVPVHATSEEEARTISKGFFNLPRFNDGANWTVESVKLKDILPEGREEDQIFEVTLRKVDSKETKKVKVHATSKQEARMKADDKASWVVVSVE